MNLEHSFSYLDYEVEVYDSLPSTQDICLEKSLDLKKKVIVALEQTNGRGTKGKSWSSNKGGLWFSFSEFGCNSQKELPVYIAVALHKTISKLVQEVSIKWYNDLYIQDKKVAGILCETHHREKPLIVCGIGVNINNDVQDRQHSIAIKHILQKEKDIFLFLKHFLACFVEVCSLSFEDIKNYYILDNYSIGKMVILNSQKYKVVSILDDLSLRVVDENKEEKIITWEQYYLNS